jgi:hypothetical protein
LTDRREIGEKKKQREGFMIKTKKGKTCTWQVFKEKKKEGKKMTKVTTRSPVRR